MMVWKCRFLNKKAPVLLKKKKILLRDSIKLESIQSGEVGGGVPWAVSINTNYFQSFCTM